MLAEECSEVIQIVNKIIRHGYESYHPDDTTTNNRQLLENEISDVLTILYMMERTRDIKNMKLTFWELQDNYERKRIYTHYQVVEPKD